MNLLLVANDPNPVASFKKIEAAAVNQGITPIRLCGGGATVRYTPEEQQAIVETSTRILIGMSSTSEHALHELGIAFMAMECGTPFALFADTFGCFKRRPFESLRKHAAYLFVSSEAEVPEAQELYPNARVTACGNPLWADMLQPSSGARVPHDTPQRLILCPGSKTNALPKAQNPNVAYVSVVRQAFPDDDTVQIVFTVHPGDEASSAYYREQLGDGVHVVDANDTTAKIKAILSADLVVSACSPSIDVQALLLGKPVINVLNAAVRSRMRNEFGSELPPLVALGHVQPVGLASSSSLRYVCEAAMPGDTVPIMFIPKPLPDIRTHDASECILDALFA